MFKYDVYIFKSNAVECHNAMSRLEGPAVCFSPNPLRFDHAICIRLGLLGLDYTNGRLQSAPARMHGNKKGNTLSARPNSAQMQIWPNMHFMIAGFRFSIVLWCFLTLGVILTSLHVFILQSLQF